MRGRSLCLSGLLRWLSVLFFFVVGVPSAQAEISDTKVASVVFESGDSQNNGYESAFIQVEYAFRECYGTVAFNFCLLPNTIQADRIYWYKGERRQAPDTIKAPYLGQVRFEGVVSGKFRDYFSHIAMKGGGGGCFNAEELGKSSRYWGPDTSPEEKRRILNAKNVITAAAGYNHPPLRNNDVERFFECNLCRVN